MTREQYDALIKAFNDAIANIKENETLRKENEDLKGAIQYYEEERISDDLFGAEYSPNTVAIVAPPDMPDYKAIIDGLKNDIAELREENETLNDAIKWKNHDHHETHRYLREAKEQITEMQATIDNLRKEWGRTIDLALAYEDKLMEINKQYPGILGDEELKALMTHPE